MSRTALVACLFLLTTQADAAPKKHGERRADWPLFRAYASHFISGDGRVIDHFEQGVTTSEGQSYALFFSLVANDRALFARLLNWTQNNLAGGSLAKSLPAWRWGLQKDKKWGVIDPNPAADADLWIGYTLVEAGRLWSRDDYGKLGRSLLAEVVSREVVELPKLGPVLLPAPVGFTHDKDTWRLNPSYTPPELLRGLASAKVEGPWAAIRESSLRLIQSRAKQGYVDDWVGYRRSGAIIDDPVKGAIGSYDAIRVYLWASLLAEEDEAKAPLCRALKGPLEHWRSSGFVPERVKVTQPEEPLARGPVGFQAVLLPSLLKPSDAAALAKLKHQIEEERNGKLYGRPPRYYDQNLLLFAQGAIEQRYRFAADGRLEVAWEEGSALKVETGGRKKKVKKVAVKTTKTGARGSGSRGR